MIGQAVAALQAVGYDTGRVKLLVRADFPAGLRGMTLSAFGGAALGGEAFSSQAMLNYVLEEELLHLIQMADEEGRAFGPGTAQGLEEAVHAVRRVQGPP
jgi:hypothetical protein